MDPVLSIVKFIAGEVGSRSIDDGVGLAARFNNMYGMSTTSSGNLLLGDTTKYV